jgi:hypothetical protein
LNQWGQHPAGANRVASHARGDGFQDQRIDQLF